MQFEKCDAQKFETFNDYLYCCFLDKLIFLKYRISVKHVSTNVHEISYISGQYIKFNYWTLNAHIFIRIVIGKYGRDNFNILRGGRCRVRLPKIGVKFFFYIDINGCLNVHNFNRITVFI